MKWVLALSLFLGAPAMAADNIEKITSNWQTWRLADLTKSEGWLTLVGLHWLQEGDNSVGSAENATVMLAKLPAEFAVITLQDGNARIQLREGYTAKIDGVEKSQAELLNDSQGKASVVSVGDVSFLLIERGGKIGVRAKDPNAITRTAFKGLDYFPAASKWRFEAKFTAHPAGKTIPIATVINTLEPMINPGYVEFEMHGKTHRMEAVDEGDGRLYFIFADRSSGKETYGPGRSFYAAPAVDGKTILDFNQAYNPPCAFNAFSTCPLPPPENRLDLYVDAGEKKYRAEVH